MSALAALLLATQGAPAAANAELAALFETACVRKAAPGADFQPATAEDMPGDVANLYIEPQEGRYWRRSGPVPAFVAQTRGPGHWGGLEEICVVGVQGARFDAVARSFARRFNDRTVYIRGRWATWGRWGMTNLTVHDERAGRTVVVTQRPDAWVSLLTDSYATAAAQR